MHPQPAKEMAARAGTVGKDVVAVHELVPVDGNLRPKCGAGEEENEIYEWMRAVNCADCMGS
ncbi:hypothetical protein [Streptomyces sp. NPDC059080]|uniref:hypothetical protein n=1 Tax=Streptomyces sp. NPDC059080 TaxID=3346718 RepID=UPI0036ADF370